MITRIIVIFIAICVAVYLAMRVLVFLGLAQIRGKKTAARRHDPNVIEGSYTEVDPEREKDSRPR